MAFKGPQDESNNQSPVKTWTPGRSVLMGIAATGLFVAIIAAAGFAGGGDSSDPTGGSAVAGAASTPLTNPTRTALSLTETPSPATTGTFTPAATAVASSIAATPIETSGVSTTPDASPTVAITATVAPTIADPSTATPVFNTPVASDELTPVAAQLAASIESRFGVRVLSAGQDWGNNEAEQLQNLTSLNNALGSLPAGLLSATIVGSGGALTFLSNHHGRTEDGWQPYGDRAANYYANEDTGPNGHRSAHQVVLQPGSTAQTIAHEVTHAFQLRNAGPGDYASALLSPEMKSFMAATGWRQLVSDDVLRNSSGQSWDAINQMFIYEGRALVYVNDFGGTSTLYAPNPLEGWAEAAGLYYAHSPAIQLPDWADYWAWFDANLG